MGKSYHFKFKGGVIVRFKFDQLYSTLMFIETGERTDNDFTWQDFRDLVLRFFGRGGGPTAYVDSLGGASMFGTTSFGGGRIGGYSNVGYVIITDIENDQDDDQEIP